jgi:peptide/nickel transport system substrate-binding protein
MRRNIRAFVATGGLLIALSITDPAGAQKSGGILKMYSPDSPASMSTHEEATVFAEGPMMGVFNNLVMYDQHVPQNSLRSIVPDLATGWSWSEDGTELTLSLREGVAWHDGKSFTARDVVCTFDLLTGMSSESFRVNPRKSWYGNLERVSSNGDYEVTFRLKRPQPAFLTALASGFSPVHPCHVSPREMRQLRWHRSVQIRCVQAKRIHQGDAQSRLLEEEPATSRWYRVYDHQELVDGGPGVRFREV